VAHNYESFWSFFTTKPIASLPKVVLAGDINRSP